MQEKVAPKNVLVSQISTSQEKSNFSTNATEKSDKYFSFFYHAPVALWIEDFSEVKKYADNLAKEHRTNVKTYIKNNPKIIPKLASLVTIKEVNKKALEIYKANSQDELLHSLDKVFTKKSAKGFAKLVVNILIGVKETEIETVNKRLDGEEFDVLIKFEVADGFEDSLEKVIVSVEDSSERIKNKKILAESEKRYKESQGIAKIGSWYYCYDTHKLSGSDETYKMIGVEPQSEPLSLEFYLSFVHKDDRVIFNDFTFASLLNKPNQNLVYRIYTKDGALKYINEKRSVIVKKGRVKRIIGIGQDVTERLNSEKKLNQTKNLLSGTLTSIQDGFVILDANSRYTYVNEVAAKLLGKSIDNLLGKEIWNEFQLKDGDLFYDNYQKAIKTNKPISFEYYFEPWDIWFQDRIIPSGENVLVLFQEITDKKISENKIKTAYNIINKSSSVAFLFKNEKDLSVEFASENSVGLFGYKYSNFLNGNVSIKNVIYPVDLAYFTSAINMVSKSKNSKKIKPKSFRIITKNGEIKWVKANFDSVLNDKHEISHIQGVFEDITEAVKSENLLEKSEKKHRDIFEKSIDSVLILKDGLFVDCNKSTLKIFGYKNKQLVLKTHPSNLSPEMQPSGISSFVEAEKMMKIAVEKGSNRFRWYHQKKDGYIFPAEVTLTKINEEDNTTTIHAVVKDISERVKKEILENVLYNISKAALTIGNFKEFSFFLKKELHKIIDTRNFYIALYNEEKDTFTTPIYEDEKEDVNDNSEFSLGKTLTGHVIRTKKTLIVNKQSHSELINNKKLDIIGVESKVWVGVPLKINKKVLGVIAVQSYSDENEFSKKDVQLLEFVADQISTTIERKKAYSELKMAVSKAQESDRLKSAFLANMSHEIRTPMNGIIGFSELLLRKNLSNLDRHKYSNIVINSSKQLLSIVNDILDISKIEAGVVKLNYENVNINKLIDGLYTFYQPIAKETKLILKSNKGLDNFKSVIEIDSVKLNQVLTNLLSNAFKFTDVGTIEYGYELINEKLQFYVKDTGIGIDNEVQDRIFDRFIQANRDLEKTLKGTGLGLAISKKFIELFGGEIWMDSNEKGTVVYFTIPYKRAKTAVISSVTIEDIPIEKISNKETVILVAEDEEYNMIYINELFSHSNFKIIEADNGKKAIEMLKKHPEIDLILMDIKMPIMNGNDAVIEIRKTNPKIPIIALSAFAMESDKKKAIEKGFNAYVTKPIDKKSLFNTIGKFTL